jgi:SpoVK/Ycf46/Vps4 family AAA+-type ATPase
MESFEGIFSASTNLVDSLDPASLRRFDLKIKFDYLSLEQVSDLVEQVLREHGQPAAGSAYRRQISRLQYLTPGDINTVLRQAQVVGRPITLDFLFERLEAEQAMKPNARQRAIGFTAA